MLPQFLPAHASLLDGLVLANTLPAIGFCWLALVVVAVHSLAGGSRAGASAGASTL